MADATAKASDFGDEFLLQNFYPDVARMDIQKQFGSGFADSLVTLKPGQWHGPVLSGYGVHLVYVDSITEPPAPKFEQVQERVKQDLEDKRRESTNETFYKELKDRYTITINKHKAPASTQKQEP